MQNKASDFKVGQKVKFCPINSCFQEANGEVVEVLNTLITVRFDNGYKYCVQPSVLKILD
jgi:hypothetical protein